MRWREGLLGNVSYIRDDDFTLSNGSLLLANSTLEEIHLTLDMDGFLTTVRLNSLIYLHPYFIPILVFLDVASVSEEVNLICRICNILNDPVTTKQHDFF